VIFCQTPEQRAIAESVVSDLTAAGLWDEPIITEIADAAPFFEAERYHQEYFARNPGQAYCTVRRGAQGREIPQALHRAVEAARIAIPGGRV
jgi:peptide methionine sulfoxide reductase MsrA